MKTTSLTLNNRGWYMRLFMRLFSGLLVTLPAFAASGVADQVPYSFGFPLQQSAVEMAKRWTPFLDYLTEKTGVPLEFKTAKDIPTFQQQMMAGQYDFAFVAPHIYVQLDKAIGYKALANEKNGKSIGLVVVRSDSPIKDLAQLNGTTMAFASKTALMGTLIPKRELDSRNIVVEGEYVVSLDSVYLTVAKGRFPAGGGENRTFGALAPELKSQLKILWESKPIPPFAFIAHSRVPQAAADKLKAAMLGMDRDPKGKELLKVLNMQGLDTVPDGEYDVMYKMGFKFSPPTK